MKLTYHFNEYEDGFEYEVDNTEVLEALKELPNEQIIKDAQAIYNNYIKEQQDTLNDMFKDTPQFITSEGKLDIEKLVNDETDDYYNKEWVIEVLLFDDLKSYTDYLKDYFEQKARDAYKDDRDWQDDPYGGKYRGTMYHD